MDRIMVRQRFNVGMEDLLSGLKCDVETGEVLGERIPGMAGGGVERRRADTPRYAY